MSDLKPMPRAAITLAGWIIVLAAVAGFGMGVARDLKGHGGFDSDTGEVVAPIKTVANAQPLVAPPVTEADVRRWAREEMGAQHAVAKKAKADDATAPSDDSTDDTANMPALPPSTGNIVAPKAPAQPVKLAPGQQIPF